MGGREPGGRASGGPVLRCVLAAACPGPALLCGPAALRGGKQRQLWCPSELQLQSVACGFGDTLGVCLDSVLSPCASWAHLRGSPARLGLLRQLTNQSGQVPWGSQHVLEGEGPAGPLGGQQEAGGRGVRPTKPSVRLWPTQDRARRDRHCWRCRSRRGLSQRVPGQRMRRTGCRGGAGDLGFQS